LAAEGFHGHLPIGGGLPEVTIFERALPLSNEGACIRDYLTSHAEQGQQEQQAPFERRTPWERRNHQVLYDFSGSLSKVLFPRSAQ
jgi:hypothetical protein